MLLAEVLCLIFGLVTASLPPRARFVKKSFYLAQHPGFKVTRISVNAEE